MQRTFFIYKLTSPDKKIYIGQTCSINRRFYVYNNIKKITNQILLSKEILKHGFKNFTKEIIFDNLNKADADKIEIDLIKELKNINYSNCLNISKGGEANLAESKITYKVDSNENILEIYKSASEAADINNIPPSDIIAANGRKSFYTKNNFYIYKELYEQGLFKNRVYKGKAKSIPIVQLDLKGNYINQYDSITKAVTATNLCRTVIQECVANTKNRAGNYLWIKKSEYDETKQYKYKERNDDYLYKKVSAINKVTNETLTFNSITSMCIELNVEKTSVHYQLRNKTKGNKRSKYYFKYYEYDIKGSN